MAIVGGALLTPVMAWISQRGLAYGYTVPLMGYVVIAIFSWYHARRARLPAKAIHGSA
jgi:fucose permease